MLRAEELFIDLEVSPKTKVILKSLVRCRKLMFNITGAFPSTNLPAKDPWHFTI